MESATQIDLAKQEAPASQVLSSALQRPMSDAVSTAESGHSTTEPSEAARRTSRGAIAATNQVRLKRKKQRTSSDEADPLNDILLDDPFGESDNVVELQPVDKGFGAWSYVAAAFSMFIVVWGFPQAFPIFQTYLTTGQNALFPDSVAIRLLAPGIQDIQEGIMFQFLPTDGRHRRLLVFMGIFIISISMILAGSAQTDWAVVLTQGVLFGVGGILLNFVHVSVFPEWFDQKKGQAMGIIWMGWRVGALVFPLICQWLLEQHGFEQTLRVLIAPMLTLLAPAIILFRGRYHSATIALQPQRPRVSKRQALATPAVAYYLLAATLFSLVENVPKMFITTFAADLGMAGQDQALTLVLLVLSDMMSTYLCGHLSDTVYHEGLTGSLAIATSIAHLSGLGYAKSREGVFAYAIAVGVASGGFNNCLFTFYGDAAKNDGELFTAIHSLFSFFAGIAILSVGPIGAELLRKAGTIDSQAFALAKYQVSRESVFAASRSTDQDLIVSFGICHQSQLRQWLPNFRKVCPEEAITITDQFAPRPSNQVVFTRRTTVLFCP